MEITQVQLRSLAEAGVGSPSNASSTRNAEQPQPDRLEPWKYSRERTLRSFEISHCQHTCACLPILGEDLESQFK
jgi:hypothetical protein